MMPSNNIWEMLSSIQNYNSPSKPPPKETKSQTPSQPHIPVLPSNLDNVDDEEEFLYGESSQSESFHSNMPAFATGIGSVWSEDSPDRELEKPKIKLETPRETSERARKINTKLRESIFKESSEWEESEDLDVSRTSTGSNSFYEMKHSPVKDILNEVKTHCFEKIPSSLISTKIKPESPKKILKDSVSLVSTKSSIKNEPSAVSESSVKDSPLQRITLNIKSRNIISRNQRVFNSDDDGTEDKKLSLPITIAKIAARNIETLKEENQKKGDSKNTKSSPSHESKLSSSKSDDSKAFRGSSTGSKRSLTPDYSLRKNKYEFRSLKSQRNYRGRDPRAADYSPDRKKHQYYDPRKKYPYKGSHKPYPKRYERSPHKYSDERIPRRYADDRSPHRYSDDRNPRRYSGDRSPHRYSGDRSPRRYSDDRSPRRYSDDSNGSYERRRHKSRSNSPSSEDSPVNRRRVIDSTTRLAEIKKKSLMLLNRAKESKIKLKLKAVESSTVPTEEENASLAKKLKESIQNPSDEKIVIKNTDSDVKPDVPQTPKTATNKMEEFFQIIEKSKQATNFMQSKQDILPISSASTIPTVNTVLQTTYATSYDTSPAVVAYSNPDSAPNYAPYNAYGMPAPYPYYQNYYPHPPPAPILTPVSVSAPIIQAPAPVVEAPGPVVRAPRPTVRAPAPAYIPSPPGQDLTELLPPGTVAPVKKVGQKRVPILTAIPLATVTKPNIVVNIKPRNIPVIAKPVNKPVEKEVPREIPQEAEKSEEVPVASKTEVEPPLAATKEKEIPEEEQMEVSPSKPIKTYRRVTKDDEYEDSTLYNLLVDQKLKLCSEIEELEHNLELIEKKDKLYFDRTGKVNMLLNKLMYTKKAELLNCIEREKNISSQIKMLKGKLRAKEISDEIDTLKSSEGNIQYFFTDGGNHWCQLCNEIFASIPLKLDHLQSEKHKQLMDPFQRPWPAPVFESIALLRNSKAMKKILPAKGCEFVTPIEGFYCSICSESFPSELHTEFHLKSTHHFYKYKKYLSENPNYEKRFYESMRFADVVRKNEEMKKNPPTSKTWNPKQEDEKCLVEDEEENGDKEHKKLLNLKLKANKKAIPLKMAQKGFCIGKAPSFLLRKKKQEKDAAKAALSNLGNPNKELQSVQKSNNETAELPESSSVYGCQTFEESQMEELLKQSENVKTDNEIDNIIRTENEDSPAEVKAEIKSDVESIASDLNSPSIALSEDITGGLNSPSIAFSEDITGINSPSIAHSEDITGSLNSPLISSIPSPSETSLSEPDIPLPLTEKRHPGEPAPPGE